METITSPEEVSDVVKKPKNYKASGCDEIVNEQVKGTFHLMRNINVNLFNTCT